MKKIVVQHRLSRFIVVGIINTLTGFSLLNFAFYVLDFGVLFSSLFSTSCAVVLSFVLNKNFVFQNKQKTVNDQFIKFTLISLTGSFVITNGVYAGSNAVLRNVFGDLRWLVDWLPGLHVDSNFVIINLSLAAGAAAAMTWNYLGYKNVVFKVVDEDKAK